MQAKVLKLPTPAYTNIPEFGITRRLINVTLCTKEYFALILHGEGGLGKTLTVLNEVRRKLAQTEYCYYNGYTTPLSLFEILYKTRDKKLLILDDIEGIFDNPVALSILKSALWDNFGKREVQYNSTSDKIEGMPTKFTYNASIIILCNKIIESNNMNNRAVLSRCVAYEMKLDYKQKLAIIEQFIERRDDLTQKQKNEVKKLIKDNTNEVTEQFNFRLLRKAIAFVKEDKDFVELFKATTKTDETKSIVLDLVKSGKKISMQAKEFADLTGKSKRTYFRIKKQLT